MKHTLITAFAVLLIAIAGCSNKKDGDSASTTNSETFFSVAAVVTPAVEPELGSEVPEVTGPDTDGQMFNLSDYRGKVVMIDFWGNW